MRILCCGCLTGFVIRGVCMYGLSNVCVCGCVCVGVCVCVCVCVCVALGIQHEMHMCHIVI